MCITLRVGKNLLEVALVNGRLLQSAFSISGSGFVKACCHPGHGVTVAQEGEQVFYKLVGLLFSVLVPVLGHGTEP